MHPEHRKMLWERAGFKATPKQEAVLSCPKRTVLLSGGEQCGKTLTAAMWCSERMYEKPPSDKQPEELGWIVGKHYDMTRFVYDYLLAFLKANGMLRDSSSAYNPGRILAVSNQTIRTKSALDAESLMGESPDWIIVDEAAQLPWESMLRVYGRSGPKRARVLLAGTMEGSIGWFPETFDRWQAADAQEREDVASFKIMSYENPFRYPGGIDDPEIQRLKKLLPEDVFRERIEATPAPPSGLVHGSFRMNVHAREPVPLVPGKDIYLGIDPGKSHEGSAYAVVVAQEGSVNNSVQVRIIDVVYEHGYTTEEIIEICKAKWWWGQGPMHAVIDQAGARTTTTSNYTDADIWGNAGLPPRYELVPILEGIRRVDGKLKIDPVTRQPLLVIDPTHCTGLLAEWGGMASPFGGGVKVYQWERNREGVIMGGVPRDRYNDASKALAYLISLTWPLQEPNSREVIKIKRFTPVSKERYAFR